MATQATAVWRFRTGGATANGAGFDPGIAGAGTDYSQQDAAQLTLADLACANTTTVTSATGGFTAAMIGNALRISGGGATTGYYWITARASTTSITVDRTPGTVSGGSGRVGGACTGDPANLGPYVVPGNTVYLRATAGNAATYPTTGLDYTLASFFTPTAGDATNGYVHWVGENGVPTIASPGLGYYNTGYQSLEGLYLVATANSNGGFGVLNGIGSSPLRVLDCTLHLNNQAGQIGIRGGGLTVEGCEIYGGTASPTASAGSYGVQVENYGSVIRGNRIRQCRDHGIYASGDAAVLVSNRIFGCVGNGIEATSTNAVIPSTIEGNTIDGNAGHGINVAGTAGIMAYEIVNNILSNHAGAGKVGLRVADGTTAQNDRRKRRSDYNNLYNNTATYAGISAGAHDLAVDPGYASAGTGDFTPSNTALQAGYP